MKKNVCKNLKKLTCLKWTFIHYRVATLSTFNPTESELLNFLNRHTGF